MAQDALVNNSEVEEFPPTVVDDVVTDRSVAFYNISCELTQRDWRCRELMPKEMLKNVRYLCIWLCTVTSCNCGASFCVVTFVKLIFVVENLYY